MKTLLALLTILLADAPGGRAAIHHAQGEMAGELTASSVLLQSRLTAIPGPALDDTGDVPGAAGVACFEWSESAEFATARRTGWMAATAHADFIVRAKLEGLNQATTYYYRVVAGAEKSQAKAGPARQFKTLPAADSSDIVSFCMGSCMNYHPFMTGKANGGGPVTATDEDKRLGYPAFAAMAELAPDFFIGAGDIVYYDNGQPFATTLPELRKKWHEDNH